ncbi:MAG: MmcQ/YjbR family DNA-binding protein [Acetobacter sp.]|nr:MmcQ/YjbR family DNA-binding protein [Acetobacter sp.]
MFESVLDGYSFDIEKLLQFGFVKVGEQYCYSRQILDGLFELKIFADEKGRIFWDVWDVEVEEIYPLVKISTVSGAFVGKVRIACEKVFSEIIEKCGNVEVFKSRYAKLIRLYVQEKYGDVFEYLWEKFPDNAVFRRQDNKKWYGAILTVARDKLGLGGDGKIEVLDLRGEVEEIQRLVDGEKYFPAYHMNKKHWFTVCLDGTVDIDEIYKRIDMSYLLAKK